MPNQAGPLQGWILTASTWMAVIGTILIAPVLPFMQKDFSQEPNIELLLRLSLVSPAVMIVLVSPFVGLLVNSVGRKPLLLTAIVIYAIAGTAPVWLGNIYAIIGSRMIVGANEAILTAVATVLTSDYFSGRARERWLALQFGSASVVAVVAFGVGGVLGGQSLGWRTPFLVYGAMIVLLPLLAAFLWEPGKKSERLAPATGARAPFPWRQVGPICCMTVFASLAFYVVPVQISFLLKARGLTTPESIGLSSAIANVGVPVGSFLFQALARQPVMRLLTASMALFAVGFGIVATFPDPQITIVGAFIACVGGGLAMPLLLTWIMSRLPFEQRGRGSGGFLGSFYVGNFLSPFIIGVIGAGIGGLVPAIGVMGWISGAAALSALLYGLTRSGATIALEATDVQHSMGH